MSPVKKQSLHAAAITFANHDFENHTNELHHHLQKRLYQRKQIMDSLMTTIPL